MATTAKQDRDFLEAVIPGVLLEQAVEWIGNNLEPEDVFSEHTLALWADNNGYVEA